jgi:hypothetical protein
VIFLQKVKLINGSWQKALRNSILAKNYSNQNTVISCHGSAMMALMLEIVFHVFPSRWTSISLRTFSKPAETEPSQI